MIILAHTTPYLYLHSMSKVQYQKVAQLKQWFRLFAGIWVFLLSSCKNGTEKKELVLYETHCASCHIAPKIQDLPKDIWKNAILPEMAARMGIRENGYDPYKGANFTEQAAMIKTGIYPANATIDPDDWKLLKNYIISMAPDSLPAMKREPISSTLSSFKVHPIQLDDKASSRYSFLGIDSHSHIRLGTSGGRLFTYDLAEDSLIFNKKLRTPLVDFDQGQQHGYATLVGSLVPTAINSGAVVELVDDRVGQVLANLHRPVHTLVTDLNENGQEELVVSEFGDLTGQLSLFVKNKDGLFEKKTLLLRPGIIRVIAKDMNNDQRLDLIVCNSQGDEGISILYQEKDFSFREEKVIQFSPVYGSSWFELIDYDQDGDMDIVTVNGDNADESYVQKPYHGLRLHINDGNNDFKERYFFPLNGATRLLASDFDSDGDMDFAVLSTFPDYANNPAESFVYLDNKDSDTFTFEAQTFDQVNWGRWFLMDAGDVDLDGDLDMVLSAFTYGFTPVPKAITSFHSDKMIDLVFLENTLIP